MIINKFTYIFYNYPYKDKFIPGNNENFKIQNYNSRYL